MIYHDWRNYSLSYYSYFDAKNVQCENFLALQKAQQIADYYKRMSLQVLHIYVVSPVANIKWFFISNTIWVIDSIFSWHTHQDVLWQLKVKSNTQVIAENSYFFCHSANHITQSALQAQLR